MRIAVAVTEFPALSQTFVLDHVMGLLMRGHAVDIHARRPGPDAARHLEIASHDLLTRCYYVPTLPSGRRAAFLDGWHRARFGLLRRPRLALSLWQGGRPGFWSRFYNALSLWDRSRDYAVLHAHSGQNGLRLLPLFESGHIQCPLVITFHGHDVHGYLRGRAADLYRGVFQQADALVVCSEFMRARLLALGAPAAKLRLIPNAIALERYPWRPRMPAEPQGQVRLLSVGRLVAFKGLAVLLDALADAKLVGQSLQLHVVGDGPLREALQAQALRNGLQAQVIFHGALPRESVLALMDQCDLYLAPAIVDAEGNTETQGVALLEAMACGLPVIASRVGGIAETLGEAAAALVTAGDPTALARAIATMLDAPERWRAWSVAGRERVERHYQNTRWIDRLEALYAEVQAAG